MYHDSPIISHSLALKHPWLVISREKLPYSITNLIVTLALKFTTNEINKIPRDQKGNLLIRPLFVIDSYNEVTQDS